MVDGRLYSVRNAEEERQLLQAMLDRAKVLAEISPEPVEVKQAKKRALSIQKRMKAVDDTEARWLQRLRQIDEELLLLM